MRSRGSRRAKKLDVGGHSFSNADMLPIWKLLFLCAFLAVPHLIKASTLTILASFNGDNGAVPLARLVQGSDGNFYGTTLRGGSATYGTLFRVTPGGKLTTLFSFDASSGGGPEGGLIEASPGTFYGTTSETAFKFTSDGTHTTLARFGPGATAQAGLLRGSDGNLYGTSYFGGLTGAGNIFKLTPEGIFTNLVDFNGAKGGWPKLWRTHPGQRRQYLRHHGGRRFRELWHDF